MMKIEIEIMRRDHDTAYMITLTDSTNPLYHFDFGKLVVKDKYFELNYPYNPF